MSPAWVRTRIVTKSTRNPRGKSYQVLYRRGGRGYRIESAGSFPLDKEARLRRDLVAGWLAAGLNPKDELAKLKVVAVSVRSYREWAEAYSASRIDIGDEGTKNLVSHFRRLNDIFGDRDPQTLTVADQIEGVAALTKHLAPSSVSRYWATHRLLLDFAGVTPNPARNTAVKLPVIIYVEPVPPDALEVLAMLDKMPKRWRLPMIVIEQTGMTVGETEALTWGDVDQAGQRFRLRRATVKAQIRSRARWVQVPEWLMTHVEQLCPLEDRTADRKVFSGWSADVGKNAMARACLAAGIPHFHPHDLRHRRLSLWHGQGVPAKELAARAGHSRASMTLDIYSHVMPLAEASADALSALLVMSP